MAFLLVLFTSIFFSTALDWISRFRAANSYLLMGAPLLVLLLLYGRKVTNFHLSSREEMQDLMKPARPSISFLSGPLLIFQVLLIHLFGGSVGREGVGIQLGAWAARWSTKPRWYRAGCIAAGISVIFGAPLTATVFLFETSLVRKKRFGWKEVIAVPLMAIFGYLTARSAGLTHFTFPHYKLSELNQLLALESATRVIGLILLVLLVSVVFLALSSVISSHVSRMGDLKLAFSASLFLLVFAALAFGFGEGTGLPGLGVQLWNSIFKRHDLAFQGAAGLIGLAFLKVIFTAGFTGFGFKGGEVTPLLVIGALIGSAMGSSPSAFFSALGFSMVWGVTARRPLVAAALGFEYFGEAALVAGGLAFISLKIGDLILNKNEKVRSIWRRGLYD